MSILTTFFNLIKPAKTDGVKVSDFNANMDTIDIEMHRPPLTVNGVEPDSSSRNLYLEKVPLADNLASDIAQINYGDFIVRTSGGDTSIEDGEASLVTIKGNMERTGYVAESIDMTVSAVERTGGAEPITATIDRDTFVSYVADSGTVTLVYTTSWSANPTDYGITVTGTPVSGDVITVVYVKEDRGTITVAEPASFNSTGWNLYNNDAGYARVVAYSSQYGYRIGGNYSLIDFATSLTGERTAVTVTSGLFNVANDGYIFITGGDETTYIYPTWTDWTSEYSGDFQTYTVDSISLSEAMLNFPYGLCAVGDVRDEINVNVQRTIQRITRIAYSAENLATVVALGVPYIYDTNYIYHVLETPVSTSITIDGAYTVSDHGIEFVSGTAVPVYTETLYGENLKDKLRTDVVTLSEQELTETQKEQVQENIGVVDSTLVHKTNVQEEIKGAKYFSFRGLSLGGENSRYKDLVFAHRKPYTDENDINTPGVSAIIEVDSGSATNQSSNRMTFYCYSPNETATTGNTGYYERYRLPTPTPGLTANATYSVMTTKEEPIRYQASATAHSFDVPNSSRWILVHTGDGLTRTWIGFVYCASNGVITVAEIYKGTAVTESHTNNSITFTMTSASACYLRCIACKADNGSITNPAT